LTGTEFQKSVWSALRSIPYGAVTSYGALARLIGNEKAVRAVGLANSKNPISIVIPCHRVIGANGTLTGYGGGLERKEFLLALERGQTSLLAWSSAQNGDFPAGGKKLRIANKHCLGDVASRIETRVR
jgi:O-6-methylguanine DNA methyltransferase